MSTTAPAYTLESIGGAFPTQAEGTLPDGRRFYFRARHGTWTLRVGRTDDELYGDDNFPVAGGTDPWLGECPEDWVIRLLDLHLPLVSGDRPQPVGDVAPGEWMELEGGDRP